MIRQKQCIWFKYMHEQICKNNLFMGLLITTANDKTNLFHRSVTGRSTIQLAFVWEGDREGCQRPYGYQVKQPPSCQRSNLSQSHCWFSILCLSELQHFDNIKKMSIRCQHKPFHVAKAEICLLEIKSLIRAHWESNRGRRRTTDNSVETVYRMWTIQRLNKIS